MIRGILQIGEGSLEADNTLRYLLHDSSHHTKAKLMAVSLSSQNISQLITSVHMCQIPSKPLPHPR